MPDLELIQGGIGEASGVYIPPGISVGELRHQYLANAEQDRGTIYWDLAIEVIIDAADMIRKERKRQRIDQ